MSEWLALVLIAAGSLASFIAGVAYACFMFKTKQWRYDD